MTLFKRIQSAMRQLSLPNLPKPRSTHGGNVRKGRRKLERPFDPRRPLHLTLKSSRAKGHWSLNHRRNRAKVFLIVHQAAERFGVRVEKFANVGNHLHLLIRATQKEKLQSFLRYTAGLIAFRVTGARKGKKVGRFWDGLAWSRMVSWGRELAQVKAYITRNLIEGLQGAGSRTEIDFAFSNLAPAERGG